MFRLIDQSLHPMGMHAMNYYFVSLGIFLHQGRRQHRGKKVTVHTATQVYYETIRIYFLLIIILFRSLWGWCWRWYCTICDHATSSYRQKGITGKKHNYHCIIINNFSVLGILWPLRWKLLSSITLLIIYMYAQPSMCCFHHLSVY